MRHIFLFLICFVFSSSALSAQTKTGQKPTQNPTRISRYLGSEGKATALGERFADFFAQKAQEEARKKDMMDLSDKQAAKALQSLEALKNAYPENSDLLENVTLAYQDVLKIAGTEKDVYRSRTELVSSLGLLIKALTLLHFDNEEVFGQVQAIVSHEYWLECQGRLVSLPYLQQFATGNVRVANKR